MICYIDLSTYFVIGFIRKRTLIYKYENHEPFSYKDLPKIMLTSLNKIGSKTEDVQQIIIVSGPGSFTGIRISIAFVQGFAFRHSIPIYLISSLRVLSFLFKNPFTDKAVILANKGFVYVGYFLNDLLKFKEEIWTLKQREIVEKTNQFYSIEDLKITYPFENIVDYVANLSPSNPILIKPNYIQIPSVTKPKIKLNSAT